MTDPKLRDALAERIHQFITEDGSTCTIGCEELAEYLLESVPGEEMLACAIQSFREGEAVNTYSPFAMRVARFLRSKIAGWVG